MSVSHDFVLRKGIDEVALEVLRSDLETMKPCQRIDIAKALEVIASTFRVSVPDEIGIESYFEVLCEYPKFVIAVCVQDIIREFEYPRLPLPAYFIQRAEPIYQEHKTWLMRAINSFIKLNLFIESGGEVPKNKYLAEHKSK